MAEVRRGAWHPEVHPGDPEARRTGAPGHLAYVPGKAGQALPTLGADAQSGAARRYALAVLARYGRSGSDRRAI
jgi:hypothetical protein